MLPGFAAAVVAHDDPDRDHRLPVRVGRDLVGAGQRYSDSRWIGPLATNAGVGLAGRRGAGANDPAVAKKR